MQFAVQDVRRLGFQKISQSFYTTIQGKVAFLERLRIENMMLSDIKTSAFSLPKRYKEIYEFLQFNYTGMINFMDMCEPMLLSISNPDSTVQRRFRNQWDSLWKCIEKDLNLSEDTVKMIKDLGIRIALVKDYKVSDETYEFYNAVLYWYVATASESSIQELGMSPFDLISQMALSDSNMFLTSVCSG